MADAEGLKALDRQIRASLGKRVRTNFIMNKGYRGHILEVVSATSGKWSALHRVAADRGISASEIAAIGDDRNDAEMIRGAGLGIAMGNAVATVIDAADHVAPTNAEHGAAFAIERYVLQ